MQVADAEVERILSALGMHVSETADGWQVVAPTRRFDIAIEEDLIEEVARIHGYEAIPLHAPGGQIQPIPLPEALLDEAALRHQLAARDYFEAVNFAFLDRELLAAWQLDIAVVALANPLSSDLGAMRTSLLPGLTEAMRRNLDRQQPRVRLFELGRVFHQTGTGPLETPRIAAVCSGSAHGEQWGLPRQAVDFHDLKGDLESLLALRGADLELRFEAGARPWLHPGKTADVWIGPSCVGVIGQLHPGLCRQLDLDQDVFVFELDLEPLRARPIPRAAELSRFPSVRRDLALVVDEQTPWQALERSLRAALGALLKEIVVFDKYQGSGLEAGFKSLAIGLILQDASRTLTDLDADNAVKAALAALERDCSARLRG
jgi:phenylalanyl-tRNA synthetase beta chain